MRSTVSEVLGIVGAVRAPCSIEGCDRISQARGWCTLHYQRWAKTGSLTLRGFPRRAYKNRTKPFASREELAWAGGLFEGEGTFTVSARNRGDTKVLHPVAAIKMTDKDALERFALATGLGSIHGPWTSPSRAGHKPIWSWQVFGLERTQALIAYLWPFLGIRRRARAVEVLALYGTERGVLTG